MGTEWKLDSQNKQSLQRIEKIVEFLRDPKSGVPITTIKGLWNTIPDVCTGVDIVSWLQNDLNLQTRTEALNVAQTIAKYGYIFVASDSKLTVKDDLTYHRFQNRYFWPTKERAISNTDYAIHLCKRLFSNKNRSNLEVYEMDQFTKLQRHLGHKWEQIWLEAEASYKIDKKKDKAEQYIIESQERAFWNLHKPPPYSCYVLAADPLKFKKEVKDCLQLTSRIGSPGTPRRHSVGSFPRRKAADPPKSIQSLISFCTIHNKFDPLLRKKDSNSSWYTEEGPGYLNNECLRYGKGCNKMDRWSIGLEWLLRDPEGILVFLKHLEKEHSSENLRFWLACQEYKGCPLKKLEEKADQIFKEFLSPCAVTQVNLYSHIMSAIEEGLRNPTHFTFECAQNDIFKLMQRDSYPRFLKSENFLLLSKEVMSPVAKGQEKKGLLSILTSPQHKV